MIKNTACVIYCYVKQIIGHFKLGKVYFFKSVDLKIEDFLMALPFRTSRSVADAEFPRGCGPNIRQGSANLSFIFFFFTENCMKMKEIGQRGACVNRVPFGFTNADSFETVHSPIHSTQAPPLVNISHSSFPHGN